MAPRLITFSMLMRPLLTCVFLSCCSFCVFWQVLNVILKRASVFCVIPAILLQLLDRCISHRRFQTRGLPLIEITITRLWPWIQTQLNTITLPPLSMSQSRKTQPLLLLCPVSRIYFCGTDASRKNFLFFNLSCSSKRLSVDKLVNFLNATNVYIFLSLSYKHLIV